MKGIILAGGKGSRLYPLTKITSKQLLPVYNKPMIMYPLESLLQAGITEILIIVAPEYAGHFLRILGSGKEHNARFTYEIQEEPKGIADAFLVGENFIGDDSVTLILGDNIFEQDLTEMIQTFKTGGRVAALEVEDPKPYGVVEFDSSGKALSIEEKPEHPKSKYIVPGLYIFDNRCVQFTKEITPSFRGQLEVVDIQMKYLERNELNVVKISGKWFDAGTLDSLLDAGIWAREKSARNH